MILDVGCGCRPRGHVNVDIYKNDSPETWRGFKGKNIQNFVQASGAYLPFKNESFDIVCSYSSLEHCEKYGLMLLEMLRVSKNAVIINVPHRFNRRSKKCKYHKQLFNRKWFFETLTKLGYANFYIIDSQLHNYPFNFFPLFSLPATLTVKIFKRIGDVGDLGSIFLTQSPLKPPLEDRQQDQRKERQNPHNPLLE